MSDMPQCTRCGATISIPRWMGPKTCVSCAKAIGWERKRRIADGTATELDRAVYGWRQHIIRARMKHQGTCADCGTEVLSASPIGEGRRCRACHIKNLIANRRPAGHPKVLHAFRIRKDWLDTLRAEWSGNSELSFNDWLSDRLMHGRGSDNG